MLSVKANEMALVLEVDGAMDMYRGKYSVQKGSTQDEVILQTNLRHTRTKEKFSSSILTLKSNENSVTCELDAGNAGTIELEKEE